MTLATPPEVRRPVRFTPEEFHALSEQGVIPERTELVDGEIIEMPAQHYPAVATIGRIERALAAEWHDPDCVVSNMTHVFPSGWNPMPDVAVYDRPPPRRPKEGAYPVPRLVVEVADETLDYDLGEKAARYAGEGVAELWVADVGGRRLWVHREAEGGAWGSRRGLKIGDGVSPLCLPGASYAVADLIPAPYGGVHRG